MTQELELGLDTFGDVTVDGAGRPKPAAQVLREVVEEGVLADQVGADFFGVASTTGRISPSRRLRSSSPPSRLAPSASLGTAVTVLSSDDPRAGVPALRRSTPCRTAGPRSSSGGLVHRVVPAVRLRPRGLRGAVRGEARPVRPLLRDEQPVTWSGLDPAPLRHQEVFPAPSRAG